MVKEVSEKKGAKIKFCLAKYKNYHHLIAAGVLVLLIIAYLLFGNALTGKVSKATAGEKTVDFLTDYFIQNGQGGSVELVNVESVNGLYKVNMKYNGEALSVYTTTNGKFILPEQALAPIEPITDTTGTAQTEIPKSDKPTAELYVFSYCPAGTAALDSFAEAGKVLKDVADMKVKFFSNMHGEHEKQQNIIQECIQTIDSSKYWDYAIDYYDIYVKCGSSRDISCDKNESIALMKKVGIDSKKVLECVDEQGEELYSADQADAAEFSLQYSPSVVINGVYLQNADRTPEGLKTLICNAFNTAPAICAESLSTEGAATSGSCS